jgi:TRAP transporter 4TM/12TM fusion protein
MSQGNDETAVWSPLDLDREHLLNNLLTVTALLFWLRIVMYAWNQGAPRAKFAAVFLGGGMLIYIFEQLRDLEDGSRVEQLWLWFCVVVSVAVPAYVWWHYQVLETMRIGYALPREYALGAVFSVVVLYLTYRAFGTAFLGVVVGAVLYAYFGYAIPGIFGHSGIGERQIVNLLTMEFDGFFGSITQTVAVKVSLFLLYAGLMRGFGAFDLIMKLSFRTAKHLRSGVAQSAVLSSLIVGSINGAQTANAAMTGSFTIPLMKESGMENETAGGIEAVASSGGQIMPPVMGAAAFVMASLVPSVGYVDVLVAGLIPALVFYISVAIGVHYMAIKQLPEDGVDLEKRIEEIPDGYHPVIETLRFGVPFGVLMYTLGIAQWTVVSSALYTCIAMVVMGVGLPILLSFVQDGPNPVETVSNVVDQTVGGFKFGAIAIAPITVIIAAVNGIVDLLNATGMPGKLSIALVSIAGGVMLFTVILAMIICLILGLGMPTVAAYTIVALLIAPTIISNFAVPTLAAHFFVFYAAILSGITPPIAIAVVVTAGIAEADFWQTALEALKLGMPLFILPFTFIYNPEIVTGGLGLLTAGSGLVVLLGAITITHGLNCAPKPFGVPSPASYVVRAIFVALGALAMVWPTMGPRIAIVGVSVALILAQTQLPYFQSPEPVSRSD